MSSIQNKKNRMLGKVRRIWGEERWGPWGGGQRRRATEGDNGSEVLARTVGDGVEKMMKKREGER